MTVNEFSDQFDLLYNNITSDQAPGLDEWEKSVFLTKAQDEVLKNYFNPKGNPKGQGFDDTQKRQVDFSILMESAQLRKVDDPYYIRFDSRTSDCHPFYFPSDLLFPVNEQVSDGTTPYTVVPISYSEYSRLMSKPYKYPLKYQAWRLMTNNVGSSNGYTNIQYIDTATQSCQVRNAGNDMFPTIKLVAKSPYKVRLIVKMVSSDGANTATINSTSDGVENSKVIRVNNQFTNATNIGTIINTIGSIDTYIDISSCEFPTAVNPFENRPTGIGSTTLWDLTAGTTKEEVVGSACPIVELIGRFNGDISYFIRYIRRPKPIILVNLDNISNTLTINGYSEVSECELPEELHEEILQRAVELAKIAWTGDAKTVVEAGQRSE